MVYEFTSYSTVIKLFIYSTVVNICIKLIQLNEFLVVCFELSIMNTY